MSKAQPTVGKQGGTKVTTKPRLDKFSTKTKPTVTPRRADSTKPSAPPLETPQENVRRLFENLTIEQRQSLKQIVEETTKHIYVKKFGERPTPKHVFRVLTDELKGDSAVFERAVKLAHQELTRGASSVEQKVAWRQSKELKREFIRKAHAAFPNVKSFSQEKMIGLLPLMEEFTKSLYECYDIPSKMPEKEKMKPSTPPDPIGEYIDEIMKKIPPVAEVIVDQDIEYLEELDEQSEATELSTQSQEERTSARQLENFEICRRYQLLLSSELKAFTEFPMKDLGTNEIVRVSMEVYNQQQILNRIKAKLSLVNSRSKNTPSGPRVEAFRTADDAPVALLKEEFEKLTVDDQDSVLLTTDSFSRFISNVFQNSGLPRYNRPGFEADVRGLLAGIRKVRVGMHIPQTVTPVAQSQSTSVRQYIASMAWSSYTAVASLFASMGQGRVVDKVSQRTGAPNPLQQQSQTQPTTNSEPSGLFTWIVKFAAIVIAFLILLTMFSTLQETVGNSTEPLDNPLIETISSSENPNPFTPNGAIDVLFPGVKVLKSQLDDAEKYALSEYNTVFELTLDDAFTSVPTVFAVDKMTTEQLIDFAKQDVLQRVWRNLKKSKSNDKPLDRGVLKLLAGKGNALFLDTLYDRLETARRQYAKLPSEPNRDIFISSVAELTETWLTQYDRESLKQYLQANVARIHESFMQLNLKPGKSPEALKTKLKTYNGTLSETRDYLVKSIGNMDRIIRLEQTLGRLKQKVDKKEEWKSVTEYLFIEHAARIARDSPAISDPKLANLASLALSKESTQIARSLLRFEPEDATLSEKMNYYRAFMKQFYPRSRGNTNLLDNREEVVAIEKTLLDSTYEPENIASFVGNLHVLAVQVIGAAYLNEFSWAEAVEWANRILVLAGAGTCLLSFFGNHMQREPKAAFKAAKWYVSANIFAVACSSLSIFGYNNVISWLVISASLPVTPLTATCLFAAPYVAKYYGGGIHEFLFGLLGRNLSQEEHNAFWGMGEKIASNARPPITEETIKRAADYATGNVNEMPYHAGLAGILGSQLASYGLVGTGSIFAIGAWALRSGYNSYQTYMDYKFQQQNRKFDLIRTGWNSLSFDQPFVAKLIQDGFNVDDMKLERRGGVDAYTEKSVRTAKRRVTTLLFCNFLLMGASWWIQRPEYLLQNGPLTKLKDVQDMQFAQIQEYQSEVSRQYELEGATTSQELQWLQGYLDDTNKGLTMISDWISTLESVEPVMSPDEIIDQSYTFLRKTKIRPTIDATYREGTVDGRRVWLFEVPLGFTGDYTYKGKPVEASDLGEPLRLLSTEIYTRFGEVDNSDPENPLICIVRQDGKNYWLPEDIFTEVDGVGTPKGGEMYQMVLTKQTEIGGRLYRVGDVILLKYVNGWLKFVEETSRNLWIDPQIGKIDPAKLVDSKQTEERVAVFMDGRIKGATHTASYIVSGETSRSERIYHELKFGITGETIRYTTSPLMRLPFDIRLKVDIGGSSLLRGAGLMVKGLPYRLTYGVGHTGSLAEHPNGSTLTVTDIEEGYLVFADSRKGGTSSRVYLEPEQFAIFLPDDTKVQSRLFTQRRAGQFQK